MEEGGGPKPVNGLAVHHSKGVQACVIPLQNRMLVIEGEQKKETYALQVHFVYKILSELEDG